MSKQIYLAALLRAEAVEKWENLGDVSPTVRRQTYTDFISAKKWLSNRNMKGVNTVEDLICHIIDECKKSDKDVVENMVDSYENLDSNITTIIEDDEIVLSHDDGVHFIFNFNNDGSIKKMLFQAGYLSVGER